MDVFWKCEANLRKCVFYLFLVLRVAFRVILPVAIREFYFANRTCLNLYLEYLEYQNFQLQNPIPDTKLTPLQFS